MTFSYITTIVLIVGAIISGFMLFIIRMSGKYLWACKSYAFLLDCKLWRDYTIVNSKESVTQYKWDDFYRYFYIDKNGKVGDVYNFKGAFWRVDDKGELSCLLTDLKDIRPMYDCLCDKFNLEKNYEEYESK